MNAPISLALLQTFVVIAEAGSFAAAARRLGVQRSTVSRSVAALERGVGVPLFTRTTRRVVLTGDGERLHAELTPRLAGLAVALGRLSDQARRPSGELRLAISSDVGTTLLPELMAGFCARYPEIRLDVRITSFRVDMVGQGFDVALSSAPVRLPDSPLVARKLGPLTLAIYASRAYLESAGHPRTVADTARHVWIEFRDHALPRPIPRPTRTRIRCDDPTLLLHAVRSGLGLGLLPSFAAAPFVAAGLLVPVLPRFVAVTGGLYLIHAPSAHVSAKVTAFVDHVRAHFAERPLGGTA